MFFGRLKIDNFGDYLTTGAGVAFAQLLSFFSLPFIAKLSGPEAFGQYSFAISIYTILVVIASLRLEYSIYSISKLTLRLLKTFLLKIVFFTSILLAFIAALIIENDDFAIQIITGLYVIISIVLFEFYIQNNILEGDFKRNAVMRIMRAIILPSVFFASYLLGYYGHIAIILSYACAHVFPTLLLNSKTKQSGFLNNVGFLRACILLYRRTKSIILYMIPAHLLNRYSTAIFVIVVGFLSVSKRELAYYALAAKFMIAPASIIISATADVIKREVKVAPEKALKNFFKISFLSGIFAMGASFTVVFFGEFLFVNIMGEDWRDAAQYAIALIPYFLILITLGPITHVYVVLGKQKYDFYWQVFNMFFVSLSLFIGLQDSLLSGVWYFSIAYAISIAISSFVCISLVKKADIKPSLIKGEKT